MDTRVDPTIEDQRATSVVNAFAMARDKSMRAIQSAKHKKDDENAQIKAQYLAIETGEKRENMIRLLRMWGWNECHDTMCPTVSKECEVHINPYVRKNQFAEEFPDDESTD